MTPREDLRHCDLLDADGGHSACERLVRRPRGIRDGAPPRPPSRYRYAPRLRCECGAIINLEFDGVTAHHDTSRRETYGRG